MLTSRPGRGRPEIVLDIIKLLWSRTAQNQARPLLHGCKQLRAPPQSAWNETHNQPDTLIILCRFPFNSKVICVWVLLRALCWPQGSVAMVCYRLRAATCRYSAGTQRRPFGRQLHSQSPGDGTARAGASTRATRGCGYGYMG